MMLWYSCHFGRHDCSDKHSHRSLPEKMAKVRFYFPKPNAPVDSWTLSLNNVN